VPSPRDPTYGAVFSPDGNHLPAVGNDCRLRVWRVSGFQPVFEERISHEALYSLTFSTHSRTILVGDVDTKIYQQPFRP
jgi:WD40 repeat protein